MTAKTKLLTTNGLVAVTLLAAMVVGVVGFAAWPKIRGFVAQNSCLDAGGAWNGHACVGARLG